MEIALRILILLGILLLIDWYAFQSVKTAAAGLAPVWQLVARYGYWALTLVFIVIFAWGSYGLYQAREATKSGDHAIGMIMGALVLLYVPKIFIGVFMLSEDLFRGGAYLFQTIANIFYGGAREATDLPDAELINRSAFLSKIALGVAAIPAAGIIHGMWKGRYNFQVNRRTLYFPDLPAAFDGYKILQFSDAHMGSFDSPERVQAGFEMIQGQSPDLILFTGDLVNNLASEAEPYLEMLAKLEAPDGKFSILGNHDYGDYLFGHEPSAEKRANFNQLLEHQRASGFALLRNDHRIIRRSEAEMAIVGVENWGLPPFPQYGDLDAASDGLSAESFKILMSHDPSHWDAKVRHHHKRFHLTLAGHTHGMQFGVELGDFRWSPVKLRYPRWADLYDADGLKLYVNRGFGYLAFPGRVGIFPEITVLELRRGQA